MDEDITGWAVVVSFNTRKGAELGLKQIEKATCFNCHLRPLTKGSDNLDVVGARDWEKSDG